MESKFGKFCYWVGFALIGYCMTVGAAGIAINCVLPFFVQVSEVIK